MDPERPIVTVSLGDERDIQFRRSFPPDMPKEDYKLWARAVESITLAHGSQATMRAGMQQLWQHRIPKSSRSDFGTRISLTFRGLYTECAHCNDHVVQERSGAWIHRLRSGIVFYECSPSHLTTTAAPRISR